MGTYVVWVSGRQLRDLALEVTGDLGEVGSGGDELATERERERERERTHIERKRMGTVQQCTHYTHLQYTHSTHTYTHTQVTGDLREVSCCGDELTTVKRERVCVCVYTHREEEDGMGTVQQCTHYTHLGHTHSTHTYTHTHIQTYTSDWRPWRG